MFGFLKKHLQSKAGDATADYIAVGDYDLSELHRFRVAARLEKLVPTNPDSPSWLGGRPRMPASIDWPRHEGEPMGFLAQIHCGDLPKDLWGGVGPRSGWLVFFIGRTSSTGGKLRPNGTIPMRVLHIDALGPDRVDFHPELSRLGA